MDTSESIKELKEIVEKSVISFEEIIKLATGNKLNSEKSNEKKVENTKDEDYR